MAPSKSAGLLTWAKVEPVLNKTSGCMRASQLAGLRHVGSEPCLPSDEVVLWEVTRFQPPGAKALRRSREKGMHSFGCIQAANQVLLGATRPVWVGIFCWPCYGHQDINGVVARQSHSRTASVNLPFENEEINMLIQAEIPLFTKQSTPNPST